MDLNHLNEQQLEAVKHIDEPLLIIAGPGTGKTHTLVQRFMYLVIHENVDPKSIVVTTFTSKAANELIQRISDGLMAYSISFNVEDMYIGTFHQLCIKLLKQYNEYTTIGKSFHLLNENKRAYMVYTNLKLFERIPNYLSLYGGSYIPSFRQVSLLCKYIDSIIEEQYNIDILCNSEDVRIKVLGQCVKVYQQLLQQHYYIDFSKILTELVSTIQSNNVVQQSIKDTISYIMVDEYQDTNYIQEKLLLLLSDQKRICVVGDDDQGLYRFRGATIENILDFPAKFEQCKVITLTKNYRSSRGVIEFYNQWMKQAYPYQFSNYRYPKIIEHTRDMIMDYESVIKLNGKDDIEVNEKMYEFIKELQLNDTFTDLNQMVILCNSPKTKQMKNMMYYLEQQGIPIYCPKAKEYFNRKEVKLLIGILYLCFQHNTYKYKDLNNYYQECILIVEQEVKLNSILHDFINNMYQYHLDDSKTINYSLLLLFYRILSFHPYKSLLDHESNDLYGERGKHNIGIFSDVIKEFELVHGCFSIPRESIVNFVDDFFNKYMGYMFYGGIDEYQYKHIPSGCLPVMTIHQAKGKEFPIVVQTSLGLKVNEVKDELYDLLQSSYSTKEKKYEEDKALHDYWRLYYTAFSRAKNLLVLVGCDTGYNKPNNHLLGLYTNLTDINQIHMKQYVFDLNKVDKEKEIYSYTGHLSLYKQCSYAYKLFKEYNFKSLFNSATMVGSLIHETIELIHNHLLDQVEYTNEMVMEWFNECYAVLSVMNNHTLTEEQYLYAKEQVDRYIKYHMNEFNIIDCEVDISYVNEEYILKGTIDLVSKYKDGVELIDIKSDRSYDDTKLSNYMDQLKLYAYLYQEKYDVPVHRIGICFTNKEEIVYEDVKIEQIESFGEDISTIINDIQNNIYIKNKKSSCIYCEFKYLCN